jgi:oligopeptide transport system substrate-binding protein
MKIRKLAFVMLAILMVASIALAGCGDGTETTSTPTDNGQQDNGTKTDGEAGDNVTPNEGDATAGIDEVQELHVMEGAEPPQLNSGQSTDAVSFEVLNAVMAGLTRPDKDGTPLPEIAESWDISEDGLTYTFHLRDAQWSNGTPVTANDFKYAWMEVLNPENAAQYSFIMTDYIKNAAEYFNGEVAAEEVGIKVIDDKTLEVQLVSPTAYFLSLTSFPTYLPINEAFHKEAGDKYASEKEYLLYNGPYVLSEWKHEQKWVYEKNATYWDADTVKLNKITVDIVKDSATSLNLYEAGDVDTVGLSRENVPLYQDDPNFFTRTDLTHFYLVFNQDEDNYQGPNPEAVKALNNPKVRKALSMAIDRQTYVDIVLNNGSRPAYGLVPPGLTDFRDKNGDLFTEDAEEAKRLLEEGLAEAGVAPENFTSVRYLTGDNEGSRKTAEFFKENFRQVLGLDLDIAAVTFQERLKRSREGNFDIVLSGWGPDYNDPMTFMDLFVSYGPYNDGKYESAEYDRLIEAAKAETDVEKREQLMLDAEKILMDEMGIAPLYFRYLSSLQRPYVKELHYHGVGPSREFKWAFIQGKDK